ncbi:hypothetical protein [Mycolicibacterium sp. 050158]|uniref:Rv1733c family protein n=1 Tax=Mycolicibacterium sp. 050158 TaxID=3090602 RepID=UPI00299F2E52|nr:hypothetical protein [Mycolicibacterium sp. 050158]MDX1890788.1 hypothetical protein [Mycolicibacterium sp. 050158]
MHEFTVRLPRSTVLRSLGRNPLVRASDRIEAVAALLFVAFAVAVIPVSVTAGTVFDRHQVAMYGQQAAMVHQITARVTASSTATAGFGVPDTYVTGVSWDVDGQARTGSVKWSQPLTAGERIPVWVDGAGMLTRQPTPIAQAWWDAAILALLLWVTLTTMAFGLLRVLTWRLDRRRGRQWEREFRSLVDGRGGRAEQQP